MDDINKVIGDLMTQVMQDSDLPEDLQEQIVDLCQQVMADPTPENAEALSIVMDKLADMNKYLSAKATLDGLDLKNKLAEESQAE